MVFSRNPDTGKRNCGCYRLQVFDEPDDRHALADAQAGRGALSPRCGARRNASAWMSPSRSAPIPPTMYSAILPLPPDLDEMMIAGFLRGKPVEMVKCETCDLEVPANSEIVLEGYVELGELRREGPFGDHTGFYSLDDDYPVFHVTCVTHRKNPIYATTIVGPPPMEDFYMGKAIERIFLPLMRLQLAGDPRHRHARRRHLSQPDSGGDPQIVPGSRAQSDARDLGARARRCSRKCIVVVDEDVDVQNFSEVAWKALNNIDPERDIQFVLGPVDSLDHSSRLPNYGSKMGVDATKKWPEEGFTRPWPDVIRMPDDVRSARRCAVEESRVTLESTTAAVAQLVVAPDCGSGCRGFKSHQPPQIPPGTFSSLLIILRPGFIADLGS